MKLFLNRIAFKPNYTIGRLYIDGQYFCDTLEDAVREKKIMHVVISFLFSIFEALKTTTVRLTPNQEQELNRISKDFQLPKAKLVRYFISDYIKKYNNAAG